MAKKVKTGCVNIPVENFEDENITAHISIRLPRIRIDSIRIDGTWFDRP